MEVQQVRWERTVASGQGPAYRIHTQRLMLRCWQPAAAPLLKYHTSPAATAEIEAFDVMGRPLL